MKALLYAPGSEGRLVDLPNLGLSTLQGMVEGMIEVVPSPEGFAIIVNEEGRMRLLSANRLLIVDGKPFDILVGNIVVVRRRDPDFVSVEANDQAMIDKVILPILQVEAES